MKEGDYLVQKWHSLQALRKSLLYFTTKTVGFWWYWDCAPVSQRFLPSLRRYFVVALFKN